MKKDKTPKRRSVMNTADKEMMMAILIRNQVVFTEVKDALLPTHFSETDQVYALVWSLTLKFHEAYGNLPNRALLMAEADSATQENPDMLTDSEIGELEAFIDATFDDSAWEGDGLEIGKTYTEWGLNNIRRFLHERLAVSVQSELKSDGRVTAELPPLLEKAREAADRIEMIGSPDDNLLFPPGWDKQGGLKLFSCGVEFFNDLLDGGQAPGEVYGLLGPFGSCKTTLAVMLGVGGSRVALSRKEKEEYKNEHYVSFIVTYEDRKPQMQQRALSYAARIERDTFKAMGTEGMASFSTAKTLKKYEKTMLYDEIKNNKQPKGELGRAKAAFKYLNHHLQVIDMTGHDASGRGAGGGYVEEIARQIKSRLRRIGPHARCLSVVVDYVGAMATRYMAMAEKDNSQLRHYIAGAPLRMKNQIADYFNCPVWAIHQLSGEANKKKPTTKLLYTDAAESKSFAENLDFVFLVGRLTMENLGQLCCDKHRRTAPMAPLVIRVMGEVNCVSNVSHLYTVDHETNEIKLKSDVHSTTEVDKSKLVSYGASKVDQEDQGIFYDG